MREQFLLVEKYRPSKVSDIVLPERVKKMFQSYVDAGEIPNMTLAGGPGIGKTTVAKALCEEIGCDYIVINGSLDASMAAIRDDVSQFASSVSFTGKRKMIIMDEADNLSGQVQGALRNFIEEFSRNCGFIFTANVGGRIMAPLLSRAPLIDLSIRPEEAPGIAGQFMKRVLEILDIEGIKYEKAAVAGVIKDGFPDFRQILTRIQQYAVATNNVDSGILLNRTKESLDSLMKKMKEKDFSEVRKWVGENSGANASFFTDLYERLIEDLADPSSKAQAVITIADYQYKSAFVADQEINTFAMLIELMASVTFKD